MPFCKEAADRAEWWFRSLCHTQGRWAGKPFELMPYQRDEIIRPLYGNVDQDGFRTIETVYAEIPKKNGKSEIAAGVAGKGLFADDEASAQVYSAAGDRGQAAIVFDVLAEMIRLTPELNSRCRIKDSQKRIAVPDTNSYYQVLSSEAFTKHGYNISTLVFDELHTQPNRKLHDTLTFGTGIAREQALKFIITTAGDDRDSVCYERHEYAMDVLKGEIEDPTFLPIIYAADEDDDWEDPRVWAKANPAMGCIFSEDDVRKEYLLAKKLPAEENNFRRLRLNQWVQQVTRWFSLASWDACVPVEPTDLRAVREYINKMEQDLLGRKCFAGLDLGYSRDLSALILIFPPEDERGIVRAITRVWMPEDSPERIESKYSDKYDFWLRDGWIKGTPGNVVDYAAIEQGILMLGEEYDFDEVSYDRRFAGQLAQRLESRFTMIPMDQGFAGMSAPSKEFETLILRGAYDHGAHPVYRWMADVVEIKENTGGEIRPVKPKRSSGKKIDCVVAGINGLDRYIRQPVHKPSIYETRGL